jgi:hypothetical protein
MAGDNQTTSSPKETIEGSEGLAPIARMILEKGFRNTGFHALYEGVKNMSNSIYRGDQVSDEEVRATIDKIEEHQNQIATSEDYDEGVRDIMVNYLKKLDHSLKSAYVQSQTPNALEELKKA